MNPETSMAFEASLHSAYSGGHRPQDAAVFYLGALTALERAAVIAKQHSPGAVPELMRLAEFVAVKASAVNRQYRPPVWWRKILHGL